MHMHQCMRAHATVQKLLCHRNYCELILSLGALLRLSFAARPAVVSTKSVDRRCSLKNSVRIHATAVSHKHHSIIRVGVDLIQFVYGSHSRLAADLIPSYFHLFSRVCCFVLLTRGWGRLKTRPPVALGSSPELFAFTMSFFLSFLGFEDPTWSLD